MKLSRNYSHRTKRDKSGRLEWSVLDWNKLAIDFYRGLGAVALDEWTTFRVTGSALKQLGGLSA